ncbi:MAG: citrate (Si)-synthase, partial [Bacteroidia bacterium]|nr:citrate (Si)-synthase [Bacteroidia bacterium]
MSDSQIATITIDGKQYEFPIITGTEGEKAIDISKLRDLTGHVTLDIGYKNTGATKSAITFLDGEEGILRHRGYSIEDLAEKANFLEVAYLLLKGELPTKDQFEDFDAQIRHHTLVNEDLQNIFKSFPTGSHPMGQLIAMISSLSAYYPKALDPNRPTIAKQRTMMRLMAKMPTICAMIYKKRVGHPVVYPSNKL